MAITFFKIIMRIPSNQVFAPFMIFDWLISVYFFVFFIIPHWVWISMNYTLPHPFMMTPPLSFIYMFLRKEWAWISMNHMPGQFYHYTFTFRDFNHCCMGVSKSSIFQPRSYDHNTRQESSVSSQVFFFYSLVLGCL